MEIIDILRVVNVILSIATLPPTIILLIEQIGSFKRNKKRKEQIVDYLLIAVYALILYSTFSYLLIAGSGYGLCRLTNQNMLTYSFFTRLLSIFVVVLFWYIRDRLKK